MSESASWKATVARCFTHVMDAISVNRPGPGRPRTRPDHVIADKGYSTRAIRSYLRRRGIAPTIPERSDQQRHRRNRPLVQQWMPDCITSGAVKTGEVEMGSVAVVLKQSKAAGVLRNLKVSA
jgi:hypothetical protein